MTVNVKLDEMKDAMAGLRDAIQSVTGARDSERENETRTLARRIVELRAMRLVRANREVAAKAEQLIDEAMRVYHRYTTGEEDHDDAWRSGGVRS